MKNWTYEKIHFVSIKSIFSKKTFSEQANNPDTENSIENILNWLNLQQNRSERNIFENSTENLAVFEMINWFHNLHIFLKRNKIYRTFYN